MNSAAEEMVSSMKKTGSRKKTKPTDTVQSELDSIKRLLMLLLLKGGATQPEIAIALNIDQTTISRMLPVRKIKRFSFVQDARPQI